MSTTQIIPAHKSLADTLFGAIFGRIWALWGIITFIVTLLIFVGPIWLSRFKKDPAGTEIFRRLSKAWMNIFITLIACPIRIVGKENFKKGENYIVACNHNSMMDVPIATPYIPGPNKTIAKVEISRVPIFGTVYKRGSILVDRKNPNSRRDSFTQMKAVLAAGMHMCLYPEGTRNKTTEPLKEFYDGAFRLSADTGKGIIPTLLFNTNKVLPGNKTFFLWPATLEMHFLPAVYPTAKDATHAKEMKDKVFNIMTAYYVQHLPSNRKK